MYTESLTIHIQVSYVHPWKFLCSHPQNLYCFPMIYYVLQNIQIFYMIHFTKFYTLKISKSAGIETIDILQQRNTV